MTDCLVAFARSGDPATPATPWPAWTPNSEKYVDFGDITELREESVERMQFHTPANATPTTPRISRD
jgi:para-nitrobenzyl esterase